MSRADDAFITNRSRKGFPVNRNVAVPSIAIRSLFATAAAVITVSIGGFIDYLATDYATTSPTTVQSTATQAVALAPAIE